MSTTVPSTKTQGQPERPPSGAAAPTMTARRVIAVVLAALVLGTLLNAESLEATAERQPFGTRRDVALALIGPVADLSRAVGLSRPRAWLEAALHPDPDVVVAEPAPSPTPEATSEPATAPSPTAAPSPTPSPTPTPRVVSAADPLVMYVGGDSMVGQFGPAMQNLGDRTGMVTSTVQYEFSSGLTRPDFIDWPARMAEVGATLSPDVFVFFIGGNDAQPLKLDGVVYEPEAPEWQAEYDRRVDAFMEQLAESGMRTYWVGMPIARDAGYSERMRMLNAIYERHAAEHAEITFVSTWDLFAGPDGQFSEYLPDDDGDVVDMRLNDGIHLTTAGAYRAARVVFGHIREDWELPADEG